MPLPFPKPHVPIGLYRSQVFFRHEYYSCKWVIAPDDSPQGYVITVIDVKEDGTGKPVTSEPRFGSFEFLEALYDRAESIEEASY